VLWLLYAASGGVAGCSQCNTEGCDALNDLARAEDVSAIAGIVASKSDVTSDDCTECPFAATELRVWQTPTLVVDSMQAGTMAVGPPTVIAADGRYRQAVSAGTYLLCDYGNDCVAISVAEGAVTTVNVRTTEGPARFYVSNESRTAVEQAEAIQLPPR